jgi:hypothetical protein
MVDCGARTAPFIENCGAVSDKIYYDYAEPTRLLDEIKER